MKGYGYDKEAFRDAVLEVIAMIPSGRATSYGAIARAAGHPTLSRMVGHIVAGASSGRDGLPAHRVVNSSGELSGRHAFGSPDRMQRLLESEGIEVAGNRIRNWKKVFWDPREEIWI